MALTTATKTLVDALPSLGTMSAKQDHASHSNYHHGVNEAVREIYGIRRYKALLTQTGTAAPVATVLENTLVTTPTWSRVSAGIYMLTFATGEAVVGKRLVMIPGSIMNGLTGYYAILQLTSVDDQVLISVSGGTDGVLLNFPIVIEVYP